MKELTATFVGFGLFVWGFVALFVVGALVSLWWYAFIYPQQISAQRTADIQSRQNVVGVQTAMRQDMIDYQHNVGNPALQQQDIYDMERLRDQLPDPNSEVPADIQSFLAAHS